MNSCIGSFCIYATKPSARGQTLKLCGQNIEYIHSGSRKTGVLGVGSHLLRKIRVVSELYQDLKH